MSSRFLKQSNHAQDSSRAGPFARIILGLLEYSQLHTSSAFNITFKKSSMHIQTT
jgi:hypothetical protein